MYFKDKKKVSKYMKYIKYIKKYILLLLLLTILSYLYLNTTSLLDANIEANCYYYRVTLVAPLRKSNEIQSKIQSGYIKVSQSTKLVLLFSNNSQNVCISYVFLYVFRYFCVMEQSKYIKTSTFVI